MCDLAFDKSLFENFDTHTVLDRLLCSYRWTVFATHTDMFVPEDGTRSAILHTATSFLQAERDIKHYIEYE